MTCVSFSPPHLFFPCPSFPSPATQARPRQVPTGPSGPLHGRLPTEPSVRACEGGRVRPVWSSSGLAQDPAAGRGLLSPFLCLFSVSGHTYLGYCRGETSTRVPHISRIRPMGKVSAKDLRRQVGETSRYTRTKYSYLVTNTEQEIAASRDWGERVCWPGRASSLGLVEGPSFGVAPLVFHDRCQEGRSWFECLFSYLCIMCSRCLGRRYRPALLVPGQKHRSAVQGILWQFCVLCCI